MTAATLSRRSFLTRAAAGAMGLLGGSVVGALSTRAWAHPLRHLRSGKRPVIDQPRSVVPVGLDEALRRERRASGLPEVQALVRELMSSGYERAGDPKGADGVVGYASEGAHTVSLAFARDGGDKATAFVEARWWDHKREPRPCEDTMPDVYSKEVIHGLPGTRSVLRFRYVDERGGLASREEIFDLGSATVPCELDCHPHPPGPCPTGCANPGACVHCKGYRNVCSAPPPDCPGCLACSVCPHWLCSIGCALGCEIVCNSFAERYCCDWQSDECCPTPMGTFPPFKCL